MCKHIQIISDKKKGIIRYEKYTRIHFTVILKHICMFFISKKQ